ncbi:ANK1 [Symbiodinium microadriaticum]|nr:ANK1 [Symbiodinium microadriaticum]
MIVLLTVLLMLLLVLLSLLSLLVEVAVLVGGELPIPFIGTISGALPERGTQAEATMSESTATEALGMTRFQAMELRMRSFPGWQPLDEPQAVLPTALEMPEDAAMAARRIDALIAGVLTIGLAVVAATVPVTMVSLLACVGCQGASTGRDSSARSARAPKEEDRLFLLEAGAGGEVAQEQKEEEEEFEMQLGPLKTVVFAVYYACNIIFLLALTSWSKAENLMLGEAGLAWEVIWLWLVVVLATDVVGYFFRAVQAAWMKRRISVTDPAISIVMSVFPVLGPRVDLLKDCLFAAAVFQLAACQADDSWRHTAGFRVGNAALLTIFLPAPALFWFATTRRDLAAEFWPALVARLRVSKAVEEQSESDSGREEQSESDSGGEEQTTWEWLAQKADKAASLFGLPLAKAKGFLAPKLVAQCTQSRLWTALGEDLPQAILAIVAMVVFEQYSGMLLVNLVISGGKIAAVFSLREFIWVRDLYHVDPVTCAAFAASLDEERSGKALRKVAEKGLADHVAALVSAGADKAKDKYGPEPRRACGALQSLTPLHLAASEGCAACVEVLLKAGAAKDTQSKDMGYTPLHRAAQYGRADCVELLLKAGVKKDVQTRIGRWTPLHWTAGGGHAACVDLLLKAGANKGRKDTQGETALDLARRERHEACVSLLEEAGGST